MSVLTFHWNTAECKKSAFSTWIENCVAIFVADKFKVVSPDEFKDDPIGALIGNSLLFVLFKFVINPTGWETSCGKPGTELCRVVLEKKAEV